MLVLDRNIPQAGFFSGQIMIYTNKMLHSNVFTLLKRVNFCNFTRKKRRFVSLEKSACIAQQTVILEHLNLP